MFLNSFRDYCCLFVCRVIDVVLVWGILVDAPLRMKRQRSNADNGDEKDHEVKKQTPLLVSSSLLLNDNDDLISLPNSMDPIKRSIDSTTGVPNQWCLPVISNLRNAPDTIITGLCIVVTYII
jgi:hypothetical protein